MPQAGGTVVSDQRIEEIEDRTGSPAKTLHGALADSGNPEVAACPDEISETVARYYALTECGRLFHWRYGKLRELAAHSRRSQIFFVIFIDDTRWEIERLTLLNRIFPGRSIGAEVDWSEYDPNGPIYGLGDDPLRDKGLRKKDSVVLPRCLEIDDRPVVDEDHLDRAHRLFYGE